MQNMLPQQKGSVGDFQYWLAGKMRWEVRLGGNVVEVVESMSSAATRAKYYYDLQQSGDAHGILAEAISP